MMRATLIVMAGLLCMLGGVVLGALISKPPRVPAVQNWAGTLPLSNGGPGTVGASPPAAAAIAQVFEDDPVVPAAAFISSASTGTHQLFSNGTWVLRVINDANGKPLRLEVNPDIPSNEAAAALVRTFNALECPR